MGDLTNKPTVGADNGTWGQELNDALDELDAKKASAADVYDKTTADGRFVRTVNNTPPDAAGNVTVVGEQGPKGDPGTLPPGGVLGDVVALTSFGAAWATPTTDLGLGTAADVATANQNALAAQETAAQALAAAGSGAVIPNGGAPLAALVKSSATDGDVGWRNLSAGDVGAAAAVHGHTASQVSGLATVATSGSYTDLLNRPADSSGGQPLPSAVAYSVVCVGGVWQGPRPPVSGTVTWIKLAADDPEPTGALPGDNVLTPAAVTPSTEKLLRHDGDAGQPDETSVSATNSASALNNAFDTVVASAGCVLVYDTAHALPLRGECFRGSTGSPAGSAQVQWGGDPGLGVSLASWGSTLYWRGYVWLDAAPTAAFNIVAGQAFSGGTNRFRLRVRTDLKVAIQSSTSTELVTTTNAIPTGQWVRIEAKFVLGAGTGTIDVGFYAGEATTNAAGDRASATTVDNGGTTIDQIRQGVAVSVTSLGSVWFGGFALSDTAQPGPISTDVFDDGMRDAVTSVVVGPVLVPGSGGTVTPPPDAPPATTGSAFITAAQAATLPMSGTAPGYTYSKAIADQMRAGTLTPSMDSVDNRVGSTALTCAIYWLAGGKTDTALLAALKTYILAAPGTSQPTTQALNPMRALGSLLMAADIIKANAGGWSGAATLPNKGGITFDTWLSDLETTVLGTGNARWQTILGTASDSANNWGSVARYALVAVARMRGDDALMTTAVSLFRRYLGDNSVAAPFNRTSDYRASWDNTASPSGKVNAGIGYVDATRPGLDGVVIDDINRGGTDYTPSGDYFGATGAGLTYPLEAAEYVWATTAVLHNLGYDVLAWSSQAVGRMGDWFARAKTSSGTTAYVYAENAFSIYRSHRWYGNRMRGGTPYGTPPTSTGTLPRALPIGDWLCASTSTWLR